MELGVLISQYRKEANLTIDELAKKSGVPKGTINKIIGGITKAPALETVRAIAYALGKSLQDFDQSAPSDSMSSFSKEAQQVAKQYDKLDRHGRRVVSAVLEEEMARMAAAEQEQTEQEPKSKIIPLFGNSFAAGTGDPDFGNMWENYSVPADSRAEFAIKINGNSMEPYLPDGSIALGQKKTPRDGDVAALLLDGQFLCKQICQDSEGNLYLFSLNRARADADVTIFSGDERSLLCFGRILMEKPVPLPHRR